MSPKYLMGFLAVLFLGFGVLGWLAGGEPWRKIFLGLATLSLGGFGLAMAWEAVVAGEIRIEHTILQRAEKPRLYWAAVLVVGAAGAVVLVAAVWLVFFKS